MNCKSVFLMSILTVIAACDTRPIEEKVGDAIASQAQYIRSDLSVPLLACETALSGQDWKSELIASGYKASLVSTLTKSSGPLAGDAIHVKSDGASSCTITTYGAYLSEFSVFEQGVAEVLSERGQRYVGPAGTRIILEKQGQRIGVSASLERSQVSATIVTLSRL